MLGLVLCSLVASESTLQTFDACVRFVRHTPYFKSRDDLDWDAIQAKWRPRADAARPGHEVRDVLNSMLAEVGASHTAVLERSVYDGMMHELHGEKTPTFGALLEEMRPGHLFVRAMYERGPAELAGLRLGDEVVDVAGEPALESDEVIDAGYDPGSEKSRLFVLRPARAGRELELTVRSSERERPRAATLRAQESSGLEAGERSIRVVERGGLRLGVVHLWMVAHGSGALVQRALAGPLSKCDAVVVDLRGRGGLAEEIEPILAPFRSAHDRLDRGVVAWRKPAVFLVDDRTRSAKEMLSWYVRNDELGPLVGEKTEGSVLGAGFFPLPGGSYLEAAVMQVPVGDGVSLEGVGVEPTDAVAHVGPFAKGVDAILERGLERAAQLARARRTRRPI
jgi:C-terminal processing protease CtpA/Prc